MKSTSIVLISSLLALGGCASRQQWVPTAYAPTGATAANPALAPAPAAPLAPNTPTVAVTTAPSQAAAPTPSQTSGGLVATIRVIAPSAPPVAAPAYVVQQPVVQRAGHVFVAGHWQWNGQQYQWLPGSYISAVPGQTYIQPAWQQQRQGWVYTNGYWADPGYNGYYGRRYSQPARSYYYGSGRRYSRPARRYYSRPSHRRYSRPARRHYGRRARSGPTRHRRYDSGRGGRYSRGGGRGGGRGIVRASRPRVRARGHRRRR